MVKVNKNNLIGCLFLVFIIELIVIHWEFRFRYGNDFETYWQLAKGLHHGRYSFWWFLEEYHPDTLRTPAYPVIIYIVQLFSDNPIWIKFLQALLLVFAVIAGCFFLNKKGSKNSVIVFLVLVIVNFQFGYFSTQFYPEIIATFLFSLVFLILFLKIRHNEILIGILCGILFSLRPVYLFLIFFIFIFKFFFQRKAFSFSKTCLSILIFFLLQAPYAYWNYKNHRVISIAPLEGGGGAFHQGYWMFKIANYSEKHLFNNYFSKEAKFFTSEKMRAYNIAQFESEWNRIDQECNCYLQKKDSAVIKSRTAGNGLFATYNSRYTICREQLLLKNTWLHYKNDWFYFVATRLYVAQRIWYSGLGISAQHGIVDWIRFIVGVVMLLLFVFVASVSLFLKNSREMRNYLLFVVFLVLLTSFFCLFFTVQARYTLPVRFLIIIILALYSEPITKKFNLKLI